MAYDRRFTAEFLLQLEERNWPQYPLPPWWTALRRADEIQPCSRPAPLVFKDQIRNKEPSHWSGVPEQSVPDGTKKWCNAFNKACNRFFDSRGVTESTGESQHQVEIAYHKWWQKYGG